MKKNIFLFLAGCTIIILTALLIAGHSKTGKKQKAALKSQGEDAEGIDAQVESARQSEVGVEPPIPEGEPLLY